MTAPIDRAAKAMQESKAWPEVFMAGTASVAAYEALDAVREPSDIMIVAGAKALRADCGHGMSHNQSWKDRAASVWLAMHDAMMRE